MADIIRYTTPEKFIDKMPVSRSMDQELIKNVLFIQQDTTIQNLLGSNLYKALNAEINNDSIAGKRKELLQKIVRPALHHLGVEALALHSKIRMTDKGLLEQSDTNASQTDMTGLRTLASFHKNKADFYMNLAKKFICEYSASFTEYSNDDNDGGVRPGGGYYSGIVYG